MVESCPVSFYTSFTYTCQQRIISRSYSCCDVHEIVLCPLSVIICMCTNIYYYNFYCIAFLAVTCAVKCHYYIVA